MDYDLSQLTMEEQPRRPVPRWYDADHPHDCRCACHERGYCDGIRQERMRADQAGVTRYVLARLCLWAAALCAGMLLGHCWPGR